MEGKTFNELQRDFDVSETTLRKKFGHYLRPFLQMIPNDIQLLPRVFEKIELLKVKLEESTEGTLGLRDIQSVLLVIYIAPKLYDLIRTGVKFDGALDLLKNSDIKSMVEKLSPRGQRNFLNDIVCKELWGKDYQGCREDFFIKPLVRNLKSMGIDFIIGEGMEHVDPQNVQNLLYKGSTIGVGTQEFGLIEYLAAGNLKGWTEIAKALEVPITYTPQGTQRRMGDPIRNYVMKRWGSQYGVYDDFVRFIKTLLLERGNQ